MLNGIHPNGVGEINWRLEIGFLQKCGGQRMRSLQSRVEIFPIG